MRLVPVGVPHMAKVKVRVRVRPVGVPHMATVKVRARQRPRRR